MGVRIEQHDNHVVEVVMDRPEALNALSTAQAQEIADAARELYGDTSVRAVVLSSSIEKAYCVGADLKERNGFTDEQLRHQRSVFRQCFGGVGALPMPTVAAVTGHAMGGGFELALMCDLIVADEKATLALPETAVGVIPGGGGTQTLSRRVGLNRAADVILTGRRLTGAEAFEWGAVDRLAEVGTVRESALALAQEMAKRSPVGQRNAKRALKRGFDMSIEMGLELEHEGWWATAFSADRIEGIKAFNERRAPEWPGLG